MFGLCLHCMVCAVCMVVKELHSFWYWWLQGSVLNQQVFMATSAMYSASTHRQRSTIRGFVWSLPVDALPNVQQTPPWSWESHQLCQNPPLLLWCHPWGAHMALVMLWKDSIGANLKSLSNEIASSLFLRSCRQMLKPETKCDWIGCYLQRAGPAQLQHSMERDSTHCLQWSNMQVAHG